jgi:hypothetical protein
VAPEIVIGVLTTVISLLALVVAYVTYQSGKQNAEAASQLSFQMAKNEMKGEVTNQKLADQRRMQEILAATEEFRVVADQVEALGLPELSDQAREFKVDMLRSFEDLKSHDLQSELQTFPQI